VACARAEVSTQTIAGELRMRTPSRGIGTGKDTLRITVKTELLATTIDVDDLAIEIREADACFVLGAGMIDALFVVERQPPRGFLTWCGVFARQRGRADRLVFQTPEPRVARCVERTIEAWLGLDDEPVRGELREL
jgi:hypothetical protein